MYAYRPCTEDISVDVYVCRSVATFSPSPTPHPPAKPLLHAAQVEKLTCRQWQAVAGTTAQQKLIQGHPAVRTGPLGTGSNGKKGMLGNVGNRKRGELER
jgi:hypothetical protein